jgi:hypothetical protein
MTTRPNSSPIIVEADSLEDPIELTESMLLLHFNKAEPIDELPITSIDVYDDQDLDKDGIYFVLEDLKIKYEIFKDSKLLLATYDLEEASDKYREVFNSGFKEIKYYSKQGD